MDRLEELRFIFRNVDESAKKLINPMLERVVYLEKELTYLESLPKIEISKKNPARMRETVAGKMYKEYFQQYNSVINNLCRVLGRNEIEEESPLREYLNSLKDRETVS